MQSGIISFHKWPNIEKMWLLANASRQATFRTTIGIDSAIRCVIKSCSNVLKLPRQFFIYLKVIFFKIAAKVAKYFGDFFCNKNTSKNYWKSPNLVTLSTERAARYPASKASSLKVSTGGPADFDGLFENDKEQKEKTFFFFDVVVVFERYRLKTFYIERSIKYHQTCFIICCLIPTYVELCVTIHRLCTYFYLPNVVRKLHII